MQVLAVIRRRTEAFTQEQFDAVLEAEAQAVRGLYIEGVLRSVWSREDIPGAVLLIEAQSAEAAGEVIATFPLAQKGMLELEHLVPLRGYRGFAPRE